MRRVSRAERDVKEKWRIRRDRGLVADVGDGMVDQVFREVVAWPGRRLDAGIILHKLGVNLVGHPVEKPIEPLESAREWPLSKGTGRRSLVERNKVPLADHESVL